MKCHPLTLPKVWFDQSCSTTNFISPLSLQIFELGDDDDMQQLTACFRSPRRLYCSPAKWALPPRARAISAFDRGFRFGNVFSYHCASLLNNGYPPPFTSRNGYNGQWPESSFHSLTMIYSPFMSWSYWLHVIFIKNNIFLPKVRQFK